MGLQRALIALIADGGTRLAPQRRPDAPEIL
jgi:hypothetical protein